MITLMGTSRGGLSEIGTVQGLILEMNLFDSLLIDVIAGGCCAGWVTPADRSGSWSPRSPLAAESSTLPSLRNRERTLSVVFVTTGAIVIMEMFISCLYNCYKCHLIVFMKHLVPKLKSSFQLRKIDFLPTQVSKICP